MRVIYFASKNGWIGAADPFKRLLARPTELLAYRYFYLHYTQPADMYLLCLSTYLHYIFS